MTGLPVARHIQVSVALTPAGAQFQNFDLLVLGASNRIDPVTRLASYGSIDEVGNDFYPDDPEFAAAELWFDQRPQPASLLIGAWIAAPVSAQLFGATLPASQQVMSLWSAISDGSFQIVTGGNPQSITGLDFSLQTNLNGVASIITQELAGMATMRWDAVNDRFVLETAMSGALATLDYLSTTSGGTDLSVMLAMTATSSGAYLAQGVDAESPLAAVQLFEDRFSNQWYALAFADASDSPLADSDHLAVAGFINASSSPAHFYGLTTSEAGVIVAASQTDIAAQLAALGYDKSAVQFSSTTPGAMTSALARILTTDWQGSDTVITLMYKQQPGVVAETLTTSQMNALVAKQCNVNAAYNNGTSIFEPGVVSSGEFIDTIIGLDWFQNFLQTQIYNLFYTTTTKVPQTDPGMHVIASRITACCEQGVTNGLFAPGTWNAPGFGQLSTGDYLSRGYYIYQPPLSSQPQNERAARRSVPFQVAVKLAGAVHDTVIDVSVNQ